MLLLLGAALLCLASPASAQHDPLAPLAARDLQQICLGDAGRLWGLSLCGPLIVANPQTREVWASEADHGGLLTPTGGGGYVGVLPAGVPIANTRVDWSGLVWTMIVAPLPDDDLARRVLLGHEAWHRIQARLGFEMSNPANAHLESERGRYFMRLEMRALATALRSRGVARRRAATDAVLLRAARHRWFPAAATEEIALDRNEGLASYTGVRLGAGEQAEAYALRTLDSFDHHEALARAYAYATGPAYGLLLDQFRPNWRNQLGGGGPAEALAGVLRPGTPDNRRIGDIAARYEGQAIAAQERQRAEAATARIAALRARYTEGPRLLLPLAQMQMEFDPNTVTPVEGLGTIYQTLTLRDRWGELRAENGALIGADFGSLTAAAPGDDGLSGPGWRLTLAPGWRIGPPDGAGLRRAELIPLP